MMTAWTLGTDNMFAQTTPTQLAMPAWPESGASADHIAAARARHDRLQTQLGGVEHTPLQQHADLRSALYATNGTLIGYDVAKQAWSKPTSCADRTAKKEARIAARKQTVAQAKAQSDFNKQIDQLIKPYEQACRDLANELKKAHSAIAKKELELLQGTDPTRHEEYKQLREIDNYLGRIWTSAQYHLKRLALGIKEVQAVIRDAIENKSAAAKVDPMETQLKLTSTHLLAWEEHVGAWLRELESKLAKAEVPSVS
jgi:membrane-associated HD superfamily phosphohydrolase